MLRRLRSAALGIRSRPAVALVIALLVFAVVLGARASGRMVSWELGTYDQLLHWLPARTSSDARIALVWVHEEEIQRFGHPLPDSVLAHAIATLENHSPRAIGVDIYRDRPVGSGWDELRQVITGNPRIVMVEKLADSALPAVEPPQFLDDRNQVGFSDVIEDSDGIVRRGLLILWDEHDQPRLSFSLQLALRYLQDEGITLAPDPDTSEFIRLGRVTVPPFHANFGGYVNADDGGYQFVLDFRRNLSELPRLSISELLAGRVDPALIRDKVVLIGTASPSVKDQFKIPTRVGPGVRGEAYGAELHAQAVDQLLRHALAGEKPVASLDELVEALWVLLWSAAGSLVGIRVRSPLSSTLAVSVGLALLLGSGYGALLHGLWIPVVPPAIGGLGSLGLAVAYVSQQERREKAIMRQLFGRFVSREVVKQIWSQRGVFMEGGKPVPQRTIITTMLTDLIGYTTASEKLEPGAVMEWIGEYMNAMAQLVEQHGGMVNDFIGDGLMANFGVPVARTSEESIDADAINAVNCALAMARELARLNVHWRERGAPTGRMRIGILTGPAVVGSLGSADRLKYTAVGDVVNTAARLESFDKESFELDPEQNVCRILVGEPTWRRLGDGFRGRCVGSHVLKGKGEPVIIYHVLGRRDRDGTEKDEDHPR